MTNIETKIEESGDYSCDTSQAVVNMAKARRADTVGNTDFPLYTIRMIGDHHFLVAGGGGQAKTGIPNAMVRVASLARAFAPQFVEAECDWLVTAVCEKDTSSLTHLLSQSYS